MRCSPAASCPRTRMVSSCASRRRSTSPSPISRGPSTSSAPSSTTSKAPQHLRHRPEVFCRTWRAAGPPLESRSPAVAPPRPHDSRSHSHPPGASMSLRLLCLRPALAMVAGLFMLLALPASGQGKDELWDITMKMEMPGMAMPARTQRMCLEKSAGDDSYVPKQENCRTVESKRSGNKLIYKMVCEGKNAMTINGEMTFVEGGYDGRMHMTGKADGQAMDMTQTYSGKRVGNCTSTAKADAKAMEDK